MRLAALIAWILMLCFAIGTGIAAYALRERVVNAERTIERLVSDLEKSCYPVPENDEEVDQLVRDLDWCKSNAESLEIQLIKTGAELDALKERLALLESVSGPGSEPGRDHSGE